MSDAIVIGRADIDPQDAIPSRLTDADPTLGAVADALPGNRIEMLDGLAIGKLFLITHVNIPQNRYVAGNDNLFDEGVRAGDGYRVIDNFFSEFVDIPTIDRLRLDPNSPDSSLLWKDIRKRARLIEDTLRGRRIIEGAIDSVSTTDLTDTDPTTGLLIDLKQGHVAELTLIDADAETKRARVDSVTATVITFFENIAALGFVTGDSYRVIHGRTASYIDGHSHDGINSLEIDRHDVVPFARMIP